MNILVLYAVEDPRGARRTLLNHLLFLPKYAPGHSYTFHRVFTPTAEIMAAHFDLIVLDTTFLCYRWSRPALVFEELRDAYDFIRRSDAVKIALPQDEYDHSELLDEWLADWRVDIVFSCCFRERALFYHRTRARAEIVEGFTGYVDDIDIELGRSFSRPFSEREIDVGYRARDLGAYFGRIGHVKSVLGREFAAAATGSGLRVDVSTRLEDTIVGDDWLRFIGNSRFTLGSDSGSGLIDRRGEIKDAITAYLAEHPQAGFDEVEKACFPGLDGKPAMTALSPRLFETVLGGSCPVLVKGWYGGVLEPEVHYIPIEPDFSNLPEVVERVRSGSEVASIIERCYTRLILDERFRYCTLARSVIALTEHRRPGRRVAGGARINERTELIAAREEAAKRRLEPDLRRAQEEWDPYRLALKALPTEPELIAFFYERMTRSRGLLRLFADTNVQLLQTWWERRTGRASAPSEKRAPVPAAATPPAVPAALLDRDPADLRPSICLVSLSRIADDPRVRRQGDAFHAAGWKVIAVGLDGARSVPPSWPILTPAQVPAAPTLHVAAARRWLSRARRLLRQLGVHWRPETGPSLYLEGRVAHQVLVAARKIDADIYLANDWHALPIAMQLAQERGRRFAYDTHEYALEEYRHRLSWRVFTRPLAKSVEGLGLRRALVASAVSEGIAQEVARDYRLAKPLLVIRNVPELPPTVHRPCGDRIGVLYHGILVPDRGLEACVESVAQWRPEFQLVLRGPVQPAFKRKLQRISERCGVQDRIAFLPPVPMLELVSAATRFDIGLFIPPASSKHNRYVLPNKFFEYIHAGLALCVSDLPDMARLVRRFDLGVLAADASPRTIAAALNGMTRERIDQCKRNSICAAQELNWGMEAQRLVGAYEQALGRKTEAPASWRQAGG